MRDQLPQRGVMSLAKHASPPRDSSRRDEMSLEKQSGACRDMTCSDRQE